MDRVVEGGGEIGFGRDDDVDAFAKRVGERALFVDGRGDERGVGFSVSLGHWIEMVVTPGFVRIVVALGFISRRLVVLLGAERVPGTDPGGWLVVGIDIRPESTHGRGRVPGAGPSEHERGAAARSTGCPAVCGRVLLHGRGPSGELIFL